jgi:hypothetical protein
VPSKLLKPVGIVVPDKSVTILWDYIGQLGSLDKKLLKLND